MTQQPPPGLDASPSVASGLSRSGELETAVIVTAYAWTVSVWALVLVGAAWRSDIVYVYALLSRLRVLIMLAAYVLTVIWLWRARRNADLIAPDQQRWSSLWVWLSWLVPVLNYYVPKQVIDDVWRSTVSDSGTPRTGWWWGTWIIATLINVVGLVFFNHIIAGGYLVIYDVIVAVVATVGMAFWIRVVRTVSRAQDAVAGAAVGAHLSQSQGGQVQR